MTAGRCWTSNPERGFEMSRLLALIKRRAPWAVKDGKPSWIVIYVTASVLIPAVFVIVFRRALGLEDIS